MKISAVGAIAIVHFYLAAIPGHVLAQTSQDKISLYYNANWELTTKEKSVYRRETSLDFTNLIFYGVYRDYTKENKLIGDGFYDGGVKRGLHSQYFEDGKLKSTYEYADEGFIIWELTNDNRENVVTRGTGKFTAYYYDFEEIDHAMKLHEGIISGEFLYGKRTGKWIYENTDHSVTDEEMYERGSLIKRTTFSKSGSVEHNTKKPVIASLTSLVIEAFNYDESAYSYLNQYFEQNGPEYPQSFQRTISFPNGLQRLLLLIAVNLQFQIEDNMIARLTVDEHGRFKKIKGPFIIGANLDGEFERTIKPHELKFLPAVLNGKPYASTIRIPISNSAEWIKYLQTATSDDVNAYIEELNQE